MMHFKVCSAFWLNLYFISTEPGYTLVANTWIATSKYIRSKDDAKKLCNADGAKLLELWSQDEWNQVSD